VLPVGERVDGADLLAAARETRQLCLDPVTLLGVEGDARRLELFAERLAQPAQLRGALVPPATELCRLDLRDGHRLPRLAELELQPAPRRRALAKLGGYVAAVLALRRRQLLAPPCDDLGQTEQGLAPALQGRKRVALQRDPVLELLPVAKLLLARPL